jgi:dTDP-glucose 4,6-dehydratase
MSIEKKSVLVTGAGGFIGSHLTERLVKIGCDVKCFVRYTSRADRGFIDILPSYIKREVKVISGDLRDSHAVIHSAKNVDVIFHLGALVSIPYSYIHPKETIETNVLGTLNVLVAAKENGVEKVVHTSTSEVYGTAQYIPIDEKHPLQGQSPYSASKIAADKIAESFYDSYDLPVAIIRPFNTYGPRQSARAIIPTIITQALTGSKIFLGNLYPTRDLTYIQDTIEGFIKVAESQKSVGEVINIGSGYEISVEDLADRIISLIGKDAKIIQEKVRVRPPKSEIERLCADVTKAKRILGWGPKVSLDDGLKKTIKWISKHMEFYKPKCYQL